MDLTTLQNFLVAFGLLAVALGLLVAVLHWWKKTLRAEERPDNALELLSQFSAARDVGDMDEQEYQKVREVMIRRAREEGLVREGVSLKPVKPAVDKPASPIGEADFA